MLVALTFSVLFIRKATLSEVLPEPAISILDTSLQLIEQLNTLTPSIDPPTLNPLEDSWVRIDKEIEFTTVDYPPPSSQSQTLDAICREVDRGAEAFRIPSSPNTIATLSEIHHIGEDENKERPPWIVNVISTENERGAKMRINTNLCRQLALPVPDDQKEGYTRIGECASTQVMCTRKRLWRETPLAQVKYDLAKNAAKQTDTSIREWIGSPIIPGPNLAFILRGLDREVWTEEEDLSLMTLALQLITDWIISMNINQLTEQLSNLEDRVKTLRTDKQPNTTPLDNAVIHDSIPTEENPPSEPKNWESRIIQLETNWAQFLLINDKTNQRMENLLTASGFIDNEGSGLSEEPDEFTNHLTNLEAFASLCDIITKSINITLKPRRKRSQTIQTNESESLDSEEYTPILSSIKTQITQVYSLATESFYTPMDECVPCYTIVTSISVLVIITLINTVALCSIRAKFKSTKKHMKRAIERKPLMRETPERGLTTAALKRESSRARDRNRERLAYKFHPTKGNSQV